MAMFTWQRVNSSGIRPFLAVAGIAAIAWSLLVVPILSTERDIVSVANAVMAGEPFKAEILESVDAPTESKSGSAVRSSLLEKVVVIRLRQAENAIREGDSKLVSQKLQLLAEAMDDAFRNAPNDAFLWLVQFWLDNTRIGMQPKHLRFLRMSYELGQYEGWLAAKRNGVALATYSALPKDLAEMAISEFVGLVNWGFVSEAAEIAAGPGRPIRNVLFDRLKGLKVNQRRALAQILYRQDLDDVLVPGIAPPRPQIPMPALPRDF